MQEILITGAGSGLGEGSALGMAQKGHEVIAAVETWPQVTALSGGYAGSFPSQTATTNNTPRIPQNLVILLFGGAVVNGVISTAGIVGFRWWRTRFPGPRQTRGTPQPRPRRPQATLAVALPHRSAGPHSPGPFASSQRHRSRRRLEMTAVKRATSASVT